MTRNKAEPLQKPKRIQLKRQRGWRLPANTVVVSRPTKWGNPFRVDGWNIDSNKAATDAYNDWLFGDTRDAAILRGGAKTELRGKNLACWCALNAPCHADVLLKFANT